jgi:hypothetical protein
MESTRSILRRMLQQPKNPRIQLAPGAVERCPWCGEPVTETDTGYLFAGRVLHNGPPSRDCRAEMDQFFASETEDPCE